MLGLSLGLGLSHGSNIVPVPTQSFDFTGGVIPSGLTYSRASTATYRDDDGILQTAAINTPRFQDGGIFIERSGVNYSRALSVWSATRTTQTADADTAPDGTETAVSIVPTTLSGTHFIAETLTVPATDEQFTFSMFIKENGYYRGQLYVQTTASDIARFAFNLQDLTFESFNTVGAPTNYTTKIEAYADGWYRISFSFNMNIAGTSLTTRLYVYDNDGAFNFTGDGTSGLLVYGPQLEVGSDPDSNTGYQYHLVSSYIPVSDSSDVTRAVDVLYANDIQGAPAMSVLMDFTITNIFQSTVQPYFYYALTDSNSAVVAARNRNDDYERLRVLVKDSDSVSNDLRLAGGAYAEPGFRSVFGLSYDTINLTRYYFNEGGVNSDTTLTADNITVDEFYRVYLMCSQNTTNSAYGVLRSAKFWNTPLPPTTLIKASWLRQDPDLICISAGQSLEDFKYTLDNRLGWKAYVDTSRNYYGDKVAFYNGATGGSAALKSSIGTSNYWVNDDDPDNLVLDGDAWLTWLEIAERGVRPDIVIIAQGEADAASMTDDTKKEEWKDAWRFIQAGMKQATGNSGIRFYWQGIGLRNTASLAGTQRIRQGQFELCQEESNNKMAGFGYDQLTADGTHLVDAGNAVASTRLIRRIADIEGKTVTGSTIGPQITAVSRSGATVTVTLTHDAGTNFTPTTAIKGFAFFDDSSEIVVSAAVRTDETTITLTLASTPSGSVQTLYYIYGTANGYIDDLVQADLDAIVHDNSDDAMPLVPAQFEDSGSGFANIFGVIL